MSVKNNFYSGNFKQVILEANELVKEERAYLIGAYCMTSQPEVAETLFKKHRQDIESLNEHDRDIHCISLFFLGLGWTRNSSYKKARSYFLKIHYLKKTDFQHFLQAQGLGFFNFFICRFQIAERWILLATEKCAVTKNHQFWQLILLDLASHIFVKRGKINKGLQLSQEALQIAQKIKNTFAKDALEVSLANYQSMYGADQDKSLVKLQQLIKKYEKNKNFYYFNLSLEYIRRLQLNGELALAEATLRGLQTDIFSSSLQRQKALWSFRFAHLLFLQGHSQQSLNQIESALEFLDPKQDLSLRVQILGLKYKISKQSHSEDPLLEEEIKYITFYCKDTQALSYAYRYGWHNKPVTEDPFAQFFHLWKREGHKNYSTLNKVMHKKWISLFVDLVPLNRINFIYLDVLPKNALVFTENEIVVLQGLTPLIRQSLLLLSKGAMKKKDFVELLWGYQYDPLRHDSLVYTIIGRLRDFLDSHRNLLVVKAHTIELIQTQVRVYEHSKSYQATPLPQTRDDLNYRQIALLEHLESKRFIGVQEASQILQTSKITACRDLTSLLKQNRIFKTGKARATKYSLCAQTNPKVEP